MTVIGQQLPDAVGLSWLAVSQGRSSGRQGAWCREYLPLVTEVVLTFNSGFINTYLYLLNVSPVHIHSCTLKFIFSHIFIHEPYYETRTHHTLTQNRMLLISLKYMFTYQLTLTDTWMHQQACSHCHSCLCAWPQSIKSRPVPRFLQHPNRMSAHWSRVNFHSTKISGWRLWCWGLGKRCAFLWEEYSYIFQVKKFLRR